MSGTSSLDSIENGVPRTSSYDETGSGKSRTTSLRQRAQSMIGKMRDVQIYKMSSIEKTRVALRLRKLRHFGIKTFVTLCITTALLTMLVVQLVAVMWWPACSPGKPCKLCTPQLPSTANE